jgi:methylmalonyl-CoA mutase C-terminal domain/subunit
MALRDAGAEVIYLGLRRSVAQILSVAEEEDVDVIGISVLSGAHLAIGRELLKARNQRGLNEVTIVMGGTIPRGDIQQLEEWGVAAVFPVGSALHDVVDGVIRLAKERRGVGR